MLEALSIIENSKIIKLDHLSSLKQIGEELKHTWETVQVFRTRTEMEVSVLQDIKHPTPDSKYWQAVREQNVMFSELVSMSYEYRKKQIALKKLQRSFYQETDDLERELFALEMEQTNWQLLQMERVAQDRIREILEWSDIKNKLLPNMKYGDQDVDAHQMASFHKRFNSEANAITEHTPPADAINLAGKAVTINRIVKESRDLTLVNGGGK